MGSFELARVRTASSTTLALTAPLVRSYVSSVTQVVRVPEYTTVEVAAPGALEADPWNGQTGGILAFLATQSAPHHGRIDASGAGFRGGEAATTGDDSIGCSGVRVSHRQSLAAIAGKARVVDASRSPRSSFVSFPKGHPSPWVRRPQAGGPQEHPLPRGMQWYHRKACGSS